MGEGVRECKRGGGAGEEMERVGLTQISKNGRGCERV